MINIKVALVGQPNVGKSHLINSISGANLRVGNFAGVTVEKAEAIIRRGEVEIDIIDLPGTYSLDEFAKDEQVTKEFLLNEQYDLILNVIDSTNLERNLYLTTELLGLNKKMVIALNMDDEAQNEGVEIDDKYLSEQLGYPCIKVSSVKRTNLDKLVELIIATTKFEARPSKLCFGDALEEEIIEITNFLDERGFKNARFPNRSIAIALLRQDKIVYKIMHDEPLFTELQPLLHACLDRLHIKYETKDSEEIFTSEVQSFARGLATSVQKKRAVKKASATDKIDSVLIDKFFGIPIFLFLMWGLFQLTFTLGELPMAWIEGAFGFLGERAGDGIENEAIKSLVVDGIIAGVGTIMLFLPNIIILFLGIALLETTGYMSRVAFLLDGFFHKFGLHGKSFIPLITGFGCSVPAYMSARTLKSEKDRLLTMFIIGFMSCGAKLPVYVLFAGAFFADNDPGTVLFIIYISGALLGLVAAKLLRSIVFKGGDEPFVMEMPKYRLPSARLIWFTVYSKSLMYIKKAGTFILAASMLIWFVSSYPVNSAIEEEYAPKIEAVVGEEEKSALENEKAQKLMESTYLGMVGKSIEPLFAPLGFDWKMSIATLSGLAAKEVIVSTLGVLYSLGSDVAEDDETLVEMLSKSIPLPSAVAFIIFVMVYLPCLAATVVFTKEAGSYKYTAILVLFTFGSAWVLAFLGYQITSLLV